MDNEIINANIDRLMKNHGASREEALEYLLGRIVSHASYCKNMKVPTVKIETIQEIVTGRH